MKFLTLALAVMISSSVFATGDAGCGLGSLIISKNSKLLQLFALTTNGSFGTQTFGITSGTSNCSASGIVMNDKQQELFVENNYQRIIVEMVQGSGPTLSAFSHALGCSGEKSADFGSYTQKNYSEIMKQGDTSQGLLKEIKSRLKSEPSFSGSCSSLG